MTKQNIEISIIIPVYNTEKYLKQTVKCIKNQTVHNFELILIDDGSTDNSGKIIDQLAENDSRIVAIHQKNSGQAAARNVGIKRAKGKYITFVDSDDLISKKYLEHLISGFTTENIDITTVSTKQINKSNYAQISNIKWVSRYKSDNFLNEVLLRNNYLYNVSFCGKAFKNEFLQKQTIPEGHYYEDLAAIPVILSKAKLIMAVNCSDYFYYSNRNGNTVSTYNQKKCQDIMWALSYIDNNLIFNEKLRKSYAILAFNNIYAVLSWSIKANINYTCLDEVLSEFSLRFLVQQSFRTRVSRKGMLILFGHKIHLF
ncbi:MAG: glycosyltransferase [Lactobacillus sp.]|nr:glycosyltransferase [Lactobacillus sp.]